MQTISHSATSSPPSTRRRLRVTVLAGGPSAERDVSLDSGRCVAAALRQRGHDVTLADIGPNDLRALDRPVDVVFPALHGTFGEDGTVQALMEQRGIRYVGSNARASALAMDKVATKQLAEAAGVPTPAYHVWTRTTPRETPLPAAPVVIKPADQGSSVAIFIVHTDDEVRPAIARVLESFERALVETFIPGDELTVGFLGHQPLPPICVRPKRAFYDFTAKYQDDATEYLFDAGHSPDTLAEVQRLSALVFERLGCRHLGRADWILDRAGQLWFLEMNTIPGFTNHSLVPKAAARLRIGFDELVERLIWMAVEDES